VDGPPESLDITIGGQSVPKLADGMKTMKDVPVTAAALLARNAPPVPSATPSANPSSTPSAMPTDNAQRPVRSHKPRARHKTGGETVTAGGVLPAGVPLVTPSPAASGVIPDPLALAAGLSTVAAGFRRKAEGKQDARLDKHRAPGASLNARRGRRMDRPPRLFIRPMGPRGPIWSDRTMTQKRGSRLRALALAALACGTSLVAVPVVHAQDGTVEEIRLRKIEAEVRALQRQVFPGGDGTYFPQNGPVPTPQTTPQPGSPASTPISDLLTRMDAIEAQNTRLTAQVEELTKPAAQAGGEHRLRAATCHPDRCASAAGSGRYADPAAGPSAPCDGHAAPAARQAHGPARGRRQGHRQAADGRCGRG
jgi:hypothetical protein